MRRVSAPIGMNVKLNCTLSVIVGAGTLMMLILFIITETIEVLAWTILLGVFSGLMLLFMGINSLYLVRKINRAEIEEFSPATVLECR